MTFDVLDSGIIIYIFVIAGVLGAVFGSFITCQADRIVAHESWLKGRSHCDVCGHALGITDLFPIVSYVVHKGKCKYCGAKLSIRYCITEVFMALSFMGIVWHVWSFSWEIILDWGLICALLGLSLVDLETYEIPDGYHIFSIVWWLIGVGVCYLVGGNALGMLVNGLIGGVAIAGGMLVLALIMDKILKKDSMGGGDIKLLFVTGLYLGPLNGIFSLVVACFIGLAFVILLKRNKIPFGPSISLATYIGLTILPYFVTWYVQLLG